MSARLHHSGSPHAHGALRRAGRPRAVGYTSNGHPLTREKLRVLSELAAWPEGQGVVSGVLPGGALSALVQFGLVKRLASDRIGGCRYAINEAGRVLLRSIGVNA